MSTTLHDKLVSAMRDGGHVTYEEVADDVLHLFRENAAEELRRASNELPAAPRWVRGWLFHRSVEVQVTR